MRTKTMIVALAVAVAAFGVAACGDDDDDGESADATTEATTATDGGAGDASVSFVDPADGASTSGTVTAEVELEGFQIDPQGVGMANVDGQGHLHFSLDGGRFDTPEYSGPNGKIAEQLGVDGKYSPATGPTITYRGLPAGEHTLEVALANNDHSDTGVTTATTFTVE